MHPQYPPTGKQFPVGAAWATTWDARRPRVGESYGANVPTLGTGVQLELAGWPSGEVTLTDPGMDQPGWGWGDRCKLQLPAVNAAWTLDGLAPGDELLPAISNDYGYAGVSRLWLGTKKLGSFSYQAYNVADPETITLDRPIGECWAHLLLALDTRQGAGGFVAYPPCPVVAGGLWLELFAVADWDEEHAVFHEVFSLLSHRAGDELLPFAFEATPRAYVCRTSAEWAANPHGFAWPGAADWCNGGSVKVKMVQ